MSHRAENEGMNMADAMSLIATAGNFKAAKKVQEAVLAYSSEMVLVSARLRDEEQLPVLPAKVTIDETEVTVAIAQAPETHSSGRSRDGDGTLCL